MASIAAGTLVHSRYGKDKVRVCRVVRDGPRHHIVEYNVTALLEGEVDVWSVTVSIRGYPILNDISQLYARRQLPHRGHRFQSVQFACDLPPPSLIFD